MTVDQPWGRARRASPHILRIGKRKTLDSSPALGPAGSEVIMTEDFDWAAECTVRIVHAPKRAGEWTDVRSFTLVDDGVRYAMAQAPVANAA